MNEIKVAVDSATRISASTKIKMGLALGLSGAAFATLAAAVGAVPAVTKMLVDNDKTVHTGLIKPGPNVVLSRFNLQTKGGAVSLQSVDVQITGQTVAPSIVTDPYQLMVYVCSAGGYGYGGYGYDGCQVTKVTNYTTALKSEKQSVTRFVMPAGFLSIPSGSKAWLDVIGQVETPLFGTPYLQRMATSIRGGTLALNITNVTGTATSGRLSVQLQSSKTKPRRVITAGDVIKMSGTSTLYYLGSDSERYVFPNVTTYESWYKKQGEVLSVSQASVQAYPLGGNVTIRPGTHLIKITTDPKVYAIEPGGVVKAFPNESVVRSLYGKDWTKRVIDVPDVFFVGYTNGGNLRDNALPEGAVVTFKGSGQRYLIDDGKKRPILQAAFKINRFEEAFMINGVDPVKYVYQEGAPVMAYEPRFSVPGGPATGYGPAN